MPASPAVDWPALTLDRLAGIIGDSLRARCAAVLLSAMRPEGDADVADVATGVCVQLLRWSLVCTAPGLSAVAAQCLLLAGHQGEQVAAEWAAAGLPPPLLLDAVRAVEAMRDAE